MKCISNFMQDVITIVVIGSGFVMMLLIPFEIESSTTMSKAHFGLGVVEGILITTYARFIVAIIKDYRQTTKVERHIEKIEKESNNLRGKL